MATDALSLEAKLDGDLVIAPGRTSPSTPGQSAGCSFGLSLRADNGAPVTEKSQARRTLTSVGTFVELFSLANDTLRGWAIYVRMHAGNAQVRVTFATAGQVTIPVSGVLFLEPPKTTESITALEIEGSNLVFEWAAIGADT